MIIWPTPKPAILTAIAILEDAFGDYAFVSAALPRQSRPDRFVKVTRTGGDMRDPVTDLARLLIECYGTDIATIEAMTGTVRSAFRNAAGTTVTAGDYSVFIRHWDNEHVVIPWTNPEIVDRERSQVTGDLAISIN